LNNINVSIMNIRTQKHCLAKAKKSAVHSVGNRAEIGNPIDELSPNNKLLVLGEEMENGDKAKNKVQNYMDNLKPNAKYEASDVLDKARQKGKVRKWLKGAKTSDDEKQVFQKVMEHLENDTPIENGDIQDFENIESKISRRNDKLKSLKSLQKTHNKINSSEKKGSQLDVMTIEKVFKITHKNDFEMTSKDQADMQKDFHEKHFADYPIIYLAQHNDEGKPHCHLMHSGKNNKTGKFDYPDKEVEVVQNYMKEKGIESPAFGKKWAKFDEYELKQHGEVWQEMNYEHANKKLLSLGVTNSMFKKLEGDEKKKAHDEFSNNPMAKKAISNRAFKNANLNEIKSNKLTEKMDDQNLKIDGQKNEIKNNDVKIEEQKNLLGRFKDEYKKFIQSGRNFIDKVFKKEAPEKINASAQVTAKYANNSMKLNPDKKDDIYKTVDDISEISKSDKVKKAMKGEKLSTAIMCSGCNQRAPMAEGLCAVCYDKKDTGKNADIEKAGKKKNIKKI
jgi:hypothetical protein